MTATQELIASVREAAEGSPYVVEEKPYGFDLTVNIVDAQWYSLIRKNGVKRVFTYEVRTDGSSRTMSITDVENSVRWNAGAGVTSPPSLHAERSVRRGRVYTYTRQQQYGIDAETRRLTKVVDYRFSSNEGRDLIRAAASRQGWRERMNGEQKGAVIFAGAIVTTAALIGLFFLGRAVFG